MKLSTTALLTIACFAFSSPSAFARNYRSYVCGSRVVFNCDRHVATMGNLTSPLDCGVSTPRTKRGRVRRKTIAAGSRWRCLKGHEAVDIGLGPVIVHAPCGGRMPKGQNQRFAHSGCLNVSARMVAAIGQCQGAAYEIQYASKGYEAGATRYASYHRRRRTYRPYSEVADLFDTDAAQ